MAGCRLTSPTLLESGPRRVLSPRKHGAQRRLTWGVLCFSSLHSSPLSLHHDAGIRYQENTIPERLVAIHRAERALSLSDNRIPFQSGHSEQRRPEALSASAMHSLSEPVGQRLRLREVKGLT